MENKNLEPLVSVVIPYYNDGLYIEETVNSILNQTYQNIEIIIVNDGSTDEFSIQKLRIFNNSKIKIIHQKNTGLSSARNVGFRNAFSEYILTVDSDDMFVNSFIEKAIIILQKNNQIAAVSAWAKGFGVREFLWKATGGTLENFVYNNQSVACALIRKSVWQRIEGYREELKSGYEDWDFWLRVTHLGYSVFVIQEPLFLYRQKKTSMMIETLNKHAEVYKNLVTLNQNIFKDFFIDLLVAKESQIASNTYEKIEVLLNSKDYKLGNFLLYPVRVIKKIVKQILNKN